ncbi:MAG: hypothetical protein AAF353_17735 [Pseudomonadota bacterium]
MNERSVASVPTTVSSSRHSRSDITSSPELAEDSEHEPNASGMISESVQATLDHQQESFSNAPDRIVYHPGLFQRIDSMHAELQQTYKPLVRSIEDAREVDIKVCYLLFRDAIKSYLKVCSTDIFSTLLDRYGADLRYEEHYVATLREEREMARFIGTVTMFFNFYNGSDVFSDGKFGKGIQSIMTILEFRSERMKAQIVPMLPESAH